jgi:hypothetical protein
MMNFHYDNTITKNESKRVGQRLEFVKVSLLSNRLILSLRSFGSSGFPVLNCMSEGTVQLDIKHSKALEKSNGNFSETVNNVHVKQVNCASKQIGK